MGSDRRRDCIEKKKEIQESLAIELQIRRDRIYPVWREYVDYIVNGSSNISFLQYTKKAGRQDVLDYFALIGLKTVSESFLKGELNVKG